MDEAARNLDAAPRAARQVLHLLVLPLQQLHGFEQLGNHAVALLARNAVQLGVDQQVLFDAQLQVARHRLWDDADRPAHVVCLLDDVEAADERGACCRRQQRDEHPDQR